MESKQQSSGVIRHRLAKEHYDAENSNDEKLNLRAEDKSSTDTDAKGSFDGSQSKAAIREIEEDMEADDEFEQLKRAPTVVVPAVAPTKYARNFVAGFKMSVSHAESLKQTKFYFYFCICLQIVYEYARCKYRDAIVVIRCMAYQRNVHKWNQRYDT